MQTLQYERRQRTEEFFSQQPQPDWPGFGLPLTATPESFLENLWDPPQTELAAPLSAGRSNLSSAWGNFGQIWPSTLWGTSVGFGPTPTPAVGPIEPLPTYNSRLNSLHQDPASGSHEFSSLSSVWGESPKRQPQQQPQQQPQPQQQQPPQQQQQQQAYQAAQHGLSSSWSSTLFSNHLHQD
jgi:hypothetical protein